jgi:hypothetical protein
MLAWGQLQHNVHGGRTKECCRLSAQFQFGELDCSEAVNKIDQEKAQAKVKNECPLCGCRGLAIRRSLICDSGESTVEHESELRVENKSNSTPQFPKETPFHFIWKRGDHVNKES